MTSTSRSTTSPWNSRPVDWRRRPRRPATSCRGKLRTFRSYRANRRTPARLPDADDNTAADRHNAVTVLLRVARRRMTVTARWTCDKQVSGLIRGRGAYGPLPWAMREHACYAWGFMRWLQLRFNLDSTAIRLPLDCNSTALHSTTDDTTGLLHCADCGPNTSAWLRLGYFVTVTLWPLISSRVAVESKSNRSCNHRITHTHTHTHTHTRTRISLTEQYNLILAKRRRCSAAGKVTAGLLNIDELPTNVARTIRSTLCRNLYFQPTKI